MGCSFFAGRQTCQVLECNDFLHEIPEWSIVCVWTPGYWSRQRRRSGERTQTIDSEGLQAVLEEGGEHLQPANYELWLFRQVPSPNAYSVTEATDSGPFISLQQLDARIHEWSAKFLPYLCPGILEKVRKGWSPAALRGIPRFSAPLFTPAHCHWGRAKN